MEFASLRVPADPHSVPVVLAAVRCLADQCGMDAVDIDRFSLAVEEAMTNVIGSAFLGNRMRHLRLLSGLRG